jgi:hypothetical protein
VKLNETQGQILSEFMQTGVRPDTAASGVDLWKKTVLLRENLNNLR